MVIGLSAPLINMSVISWHAVSLVKELWENYGTTESHKQILSSKVVSSTSQPDMVSIGLYW